MTRPALGCFLVFCAVAGWAGEVTSASHEERLRAGNQRRVQAARAAFDAWQRQGSGGKSHALVSFSSHLGVADVQRLLRTCECEPVQIFRTIGELQLGLEGDARRVMQADAAAAVGSDLAASIRFGLQVERMLPPDDTPSEVERARREKARRAREIVLRDADAGQPRLSGVLVAASVDGLRALSREPQVLAIEIEQGSARRFPVTIDLLHSPS